MNVERSAHRRIEARLSIKLWALGVALLLAGALPTAARAGDAILTWDANTEASLAGYKIYYGTTPGSYTTILDVGNVTTYTVAGLSATTYFAVTAYDNTGSESGYSNEVSKTFSPASDTTPPADVQGFSAQASNGAITLSWTNPPDADFAGVRIRYRTDRFPSGINDGTLLGDFTGQPGASGSATHSNPAVGLTYYYAASSYDASGNFQTTAYASASLGGQASAVSDPSTGGCGMIVPSGGNGAGPAQAADLVLLVAVALFMAWRRRALRGGFVRLQACARISARSRATGWFSASLRHLAAFRIRRVAPCRNSGSFVHRPLGFGSPGFLRWPCLPLSDAAMAEAAR